jgi:hypothetical protein
MTRRIIAALLAYLIAVAPALAAGPGTVTFPAANSIPYKVTFDGSGAYSSTNSLVDINNPANGATIAGGSLQVTVQNAPSVTANIGTTNGLALDASLQGLLLTQGGPTASKTGPLVFGSVTTAAPTYVTGQTSPLSIDTAGGLRVSIIAGGGSGGTASTFGAAFPATGTAIGVKNGTNMVNLAADASSNLLVNLATALPAGTAIVGKIGIDQTTDVTTNGVEIAPTTGSAAGIVSVVSGAAEATHVLKASAGNLYSAYATNLTETAGFLAVLNATSAPVDGAMTPLDCVPLPAGGVAGINYSPGPPARYSTGITAVVTSAATCFTKTTGVITAFISGAAK